MFPGARFWNRSPSPSGSEHHKERLQQAAEKRQFTQTCCTIHEFNRDLRALERTTTEKPFQPDEDSPQKSKVPRLNGTALIEQRLNDLGRVRAAAGQLAQKYHALVDRLTLVLFVLLFMALLCLHLYAHYPGAKHEHYTVFLTLFLGLLVMAFAIIFCVRFGRIERKWMDFRSLAEALRVQFY